MSDIIAAFLAGVLVGCIFTLYIEFGYVIIGELNRKRRGGR